MPEERVEPDFEEPRANAVWGLWDEAVLEAVFTHSDIGLHVLDTELRVVRVNTVGVGIRGIPPERLVGLPAAEAYALAGVSVDVDVLRTVLATGRSAVDRLVTGRPPTDPRAEHVFSASVYRLQDTAGHVLGLVIASTDVTARERARSRLRLLQDAHERIGTSLDVERTARELVDLTLPRFAEAVVVALTDTVLRGREPGLRSRNPSPLLRCAAAGRTDTGPPVPAAGTTLLPGIFGDTLPSTAVLLPGDEDGAPAGTRLVAPLTVRGQIFGVVAFQRSADAEPYVADDVELVEGITDRTATCLENALRFTREHVIMTALQSWPLRQEEATQRAVEVAQRHRPGGSGAGAWFEVVPLPGARVALVVGQVEHAGLSAVATMSRLRTAVHSLTTLDLDPHELLARLHDTTLRLAAEHTSGPDKDRPTASCTVAVHDPVGGRLDIARAGTSLFAVVRPDGSIDTKPVDEGPLLGAEGPPFACAEHVLPEGSTLCLASSATGCDADPPTEDLLRALGRPDRGVETMADAVEKLLARDRVVLLARTRHLPPSELAEWAVPFDFEAVGAARAHVEECLRRWNHPADAFTVALVASELVTNAVRYGAPPLTLRLIRGSGTTLICEVGDAGQAVPHLRHAKAVDEGGRGLLICATLAKNWGVRHTDQGKTVWAELGEEDDTSPG
ncbi:SpoIIE family protein phosphatase [Streptomyces sp. CB02261]|uniref:SpoIIE family protein phosphatase n=1 Tax=Streptomyces sp. CB02261 TaxID=1703940 RepID=UPI0009A0D8C8|nr:SpoIIE family protein phosphatase [Streptomyces sp. CB02261]